MVIQHNMAAMNSSRQLGITSKNQAKSTEKLSSGYRINRAADDAAGLAISEKMRGQIRGLTQASTNSEDAISLVQTAEGAMQESQNVIHRMRELAVQAANDTNTDDDRQQIQKEINQLTNEVDRIATTTEFNTMKLLDGSQAGPLQECDGEASIEGSFTSGYVGVLAPEASVARLSSMNDVIRLTIQSDISDVGEVTFGTDISESIINVNSLQGYQFTNLDSISIEDNGDGSATLSLGNTKYTDEEEMRAGESGSEALEFKIENFANLKAGDVITISMLKGQASGMAEEGKDSLHFQVGANAGQEINLNIQSIKAKALHIVQTSTSYSEEGGLYTGKALDVTTQAKASMAIEAYDMALTRISTERANLGAMQNRLEHTIANLDTSAENLQASESRIRDVDMADEMVEFSKSNILQQAGTSMLSNANSSTQTVLQLIQQ